MRIRQGIRNNLSRTAASVALALFASLAVPVTAQAYTYPAPGHTAALSPVKPYNLPQSKANTNTVKSILQVVFGIIGAFALLMMTASGFKYITSAGDAGKTSEAKKGVLFALVGLTIAITAEAIVAFVIHRGAPGP